MAADLQTLVTQLSSSNIAQRAFAAESLARLGRDSQPAAAALVATLRTADATTRDWATAALEELGPPPAAQILDLVKLATDPSLDVAYWAITLLGRAGAAAAPAMDTLTTLLRSSPENSLQERAAWALGKIGPVAKSAAAVLHEGTKSTNPRLARLAKQAIGEIE
jgi:HEAT repeat protein